MRKALIIDSSLAEKFKAEVSYYEDGLTMYGEAKNKIACLLIDFLFNSKEFPEIVEIE